MKICKKCHVEQELSEFHKAPNTKDGHRSACKTCMNKYRIANFERIEQKKKEWYDTHTEHNKQVRKEYRQNNKEAIALAKKAWAVNNPDKIRASQRRRSVAGKGITPQWTINNPDKVKIIKKNYKHRRRLKESAGSITTNELRVWLEDSPKICEYCSTSCQDNYHIDHIDPLSKSGKHEITNLAISCPTCNLNKSSRTLLLWFASKF